MNLLITRRARNDYEALPPPTQKLVDKQLTFLVNDLHHPSLKAKKYDERHGVWQARITRDYRVYFVIEKDTYVILSMTKHPK